MACDHDWVPMLSLPSDLCLRCDGVRADPVRAAERRVAARAARACNDLRQSLDTLTGLAIRDVGPG